MVNNESDSESECFESAEESLEEEEGAEEKRERKGRPKRNSKESESEIAEPVVSQNDNEKVEDVSANLSYRKRPERIKRSPSIPTQNVNSRIKKSSDTVFKTDVADVFFQDITSNLSKNINKSLHSLQQTSSNVKDLILSSLPSPSPCEEGFVYDESLDISPPSSDNKDEIFDDKTVFTNDCLSESPKPEPVQNQEANALDIPNIESNDKETFALKKESLELSSPTNIAQISDLETSHLNNSKIIGFKKLKSNTSTLGINDGKLDSRADKKNENLQNSEESRSEEQPLELNNEKILEDGVNEASLGPPATNISSQNNLNSNEFGTKKMKKNKDDDSNFSSKIVPPSIVTKVHNFEVTSLQSPIPGDSLVSEEFYLDPTSKGESLNVDSENISLQSKKEINEDFKTEMDKKEEAVEMLCESKVDMGKTQERKKSNDLKMNAGELRRNEIIIIKNEVNDKKEASELKALETVSDEIGSGWDDFDFSDNEIENINTEDINKCAKLDEFQNSVDIKIKTNVSKKASDSEKETDPNSTDQNISNAVSSKTYSKDVNKGHKRKETSEKEEFDEGWGWENWDDEADEKEVESVHKTTVENSDRVNSVPDDEVKWSGWDNFSQKIEEKQGNWNLGTWGVNLLLNKATAVTQGISNVLEAGLGAPDPETLARIQKEEERKIMEEMGKVGSDEHLEEMPKKNSLTGVNLFPVSGITNLVAGVTSKIVEHTKIQEIGSKVLTGGLDTLETFGKKTMEVLQDGDPGLRNKRALLTGNNKPVLSQILREAREKADKEIKQAEEKALAKKCHFETLFDDFQGMVHLEALEMLSRQYELKLEQLKNGMSSEELEDLEGVLEEVEQLCALDDLDINSVLDFKTSLQMAVEPLKEEISVEKIIQVHDNANKWLQTASELEPSQRSLHQKAVSTVAELTAATVHQFLKAGELLSIKECRKTVDEIDALAKLTNILCMEINKLCEKFIVMAQKKSKKELVSTDTISEKVIIMRNNSTSYIKQAFNLLIPVLQAGAAL